MSILSNRLVRCAAAVNAPFPSALQDQHTAQPLETVRGNATRFEWGFFSTSGTPYDLSSVETLNLRVKASQIDPTTLADKTILASALDLTMNTATWADGSKSHAAFDFSNAEMNLDPGGVRRTLWIVVTAILTSGKEVTLAAGSFFLHEDNNAAADPPPQNPGTAISMEQADARYMSSSVTTVPVSENYAKLITNFPSGNNIRIVATAAGSAGNNLTVEFHTSAPGGGSAGKIGDRIWVRISSTNGVSSGEITTTLYDLVNLINGNFNVNQHITAEIMPGADGYARAGLLSPTNLAIPSPTPVITNLGQAAIVSHSDGTKTEWAAASMTQWLPRTAGILKHANGPWYRASLAADGTAQYDLLPNQ